MQFENVDLRGRWTMAHDGEVPTIDRLLEDLQDANLRSAKLSREIAELRRLLEESKVPEGRDAILLEIETAIADALGSDGYKAYHVIQKLKAQPPK